MFDFIELAKCRLNLRLRFQVRHAELRATGSVYKTELCRAWATGTCKAKIRAARGHNSCLVCFGCTPLGTRIGITLRALTACQSARANFCLLQQISLTVVYRPWSLPVLQAGDTCRYAHGVKELRGNGMSSMTANAMPSPDPRLMQLTAAMTCHFTSPACPCEGIHGLHGGGLHGHRWGADGCRS